MIIILTSLQLLSTLFVSLLPMPAFRDLGGCGVCLEVDAWNTKRQLEKLNFEMKLEKTRCGLMNTDSH